MTYVDGSESKFRVACRSWALPMISCSPPSVTPRGRGPPCSGLGATSVVICARPVPVPASIRSGRCTSEDLILPLGEKRPEEAVFTCECAQGSDVETETYRGRCTEALTAICPESLRTNASSPLAIKDFGKLCEKDEDCELGACYVPGTKRDSICSKRCDSTKDCPEGTLCAFDHCFIACSGDDEECLYLNAAIDNPLQCFNLSPSFGQGQICIQESEP